MQKNSDKTVPTIWCQLYKLQKEGKLIFRANSQSSMLAGSKCGEVGLGGCMLYRRTKWGSSPSCVKSSGRQTFYTTQRFGPDNLRSSAWDYILHLIIMLSTLVIITFYNFHLLKYSTWYLAYINSSVNFYRWIDERKMEKRAESIIFWVWNVV